jgi:hypothetical protein
MPQGNAMDNMKSGGGEKGDDYKYMTPADRK